MQVEQLVERARILQAARLDYTSKGQPDLPCAPASACMQLPSAHPELAIHPGTWPLDAAPALAWTVC